MGVYRQRVQGNNHQPAFVGGRCDDMVLSFSNSLGWNVQERYSQGQPVNPKEDGLAVFLFTRYSQGDIGTAILPHLTTSEWSVCEKRKDPSSVRVEKFKKRESMLKLSDGQGSRAGIFCEGIYRKQNRFHDEKSIYSNSNNDRVIWFMGGFGWCVGVEKDIGTHSCLMHANDLAQTPDAVQSIWMVLIDSAKDPRVQVVLASAECTPSPSVQQHTPAPVSASLELHAAPESTSPPPAIAVVGVGKGYSGLYKILQHWQGRKLTVMMYESARTDSSRVIWYSSSVKGGGRWFVGPRGRDGNMGIFISACDPATSPLTIKATWEESVRKPCRSVRVVKSKKRHTKVIDVKGVPASCEALARMNGKYRQQALKIDGRPTFKGGQDGNLAIWYSESAGSWCIGDGTLVGTAVYHIHAKDTASMPNAVTSTWNVMNGLRANSYAKIILPSIEAAEQEVPRQMKLKMAEVMAAEQKRCLGCGHQYTAQAEVMFHEGCMHHHCVCCGQEEGDDSCAVCAEEDR
jgi:hypothetical protein